MIDKADYTEEEILNDFRANIEMKIVEEQLEYYWIRVYTKEEYDIKPGTIVNLAHMPTTETLELMFTNYDKVGKTNTQSEDLEEFEKEENKKVLCLLVNMTDLYKRTDVDLIRKLFRKSKYYEEILLKRKDLKIFTEHVNFLDEKYMESPDNKLKDGLIIEYYDILF